MDTGKNETIRTELGHHLFVVVNTRKKKLKMLKGKSEAVTLRNTMTKRKKGTRQTMTHKTLHRTLTSE